MASAWAGACGSRTGLSPDPAVDDGGGPVADASADSAAPDGATPPEGWAVGFNSVCMLQADGGAGCFELPSDPASSTYHATLEPVEGVSEATQIAGHEGFCARLRDGTVTCWKRLANDGGFAMSPATAVEGLGDVVQIDVANIGGGGYGCAVRADGSVWCWGSDDYNNLGLGNHCPGGVGDCDGSMHTPGPVWSPDRSVPVVVPAAHGALGLALSEGETLATLPGEFLYFGTPMGGEGPVAHSPVTQARAAGERAYGSQYDTFCTKAPGAPVHCTGGFALDGDVSTPAAPYDVPGTEDATDVNVSTFTGCARLSVADLLCWGQYTLGPTHIHIDG